ncbi:EamA family transporter [cf. Phormidesmis sp. LEGE 11477]|uniref:EamA family transporter n=1 Tax=cf. Phormidesmis sp. LEGE 11477 TaxID=1828680 RepID=UPI0018804419|nr:DMT family transporter [cf. Phormidesmis sp. LEGE 11477]MBE9061528.1 EamA family transporter [cf. Phormidesmis sp. LEGE 11477]
MWFLFASLTAFFEACKDATGKQSLKTLDEYSVLFSFMAVGVVLMLPILWLSGGIPALQPNFWWALLIGGGLNILAFTLYVRAIKIADLSLTVPLVTLTPLFLLITSPLIVNEQPTLADAIGVVLLVIGSYVLNITPARRNIWAPLLSMAQNPGSRLMLCVAFIWSITSNFDKIGVVNSSPLFWAMSLFAVIAGGMVPFVFWRSSSAGLTPLLSQWQLLGVTGGFNAIAITCQMLALTIAPVAQVIAVKRMSALLSVLFGYFIFGEKGLRARLLGASIMVSGVVLMSLR